MSQNPPKLKLWMVKDVCTHVAKAASCVTVTKEGRKGGRDGRVGKKERDRKREGWGWRKGGKDKRREEVRKLEWEQKRAVSPQDRLEVSLYKSTYL